MLRRLCWLNIQDPKHNHRWVEAFYVIVLEPDSGLEASDSDNFGSLFAKVSPGGCLRLEFVRALKWLRDVAALNT